MTSNQNKIRLVISMIFLLCAFTAVDLQAQQNIVHKFKGNVWTKEKVNANVKPQAFLSPGVNFAAMKKGDVAKKISLSQGDLGIAATTAFELPERYWTHIPGMATVIELQPVVLLGAPLKYEPATKDFRGSLSIYLREVGQTVSRPLSIPLQMLVRTNADRVIPASLGFGHTYFPPQDVQVISGNPQNVVKVRFITEIDTSGYDIDVAVEPGLTNQTGQTRLQAYGVEKASLVIVMRPLVTTGPLSVSVTATSGYVSPETVDLRSGQATVTVRSSGVGKSTVTVVGSGYRPAQAELEYIFPWAFLIATLLGSMIGAFLWREEGFGFGQFLRRMLMGLIVVVAWVILGLNLLNIPLPTYYNEGLAFVLGALGSLSLNLKNLKNLKGKKRDASSGVAPGNG